MNNDFLLFFLAMTILFQFIGLNFIILKKRLSYYNHRYIFIYLFIIALELETIFVYIYKKHNLPDEINDTANIEISDRIEIISNNLSDVSAEILLIQQELEGRIDYVEKLKQEAEIAENVISLSEEQVNAVQAKLSQELEASNSKSFIQSFIPGAIFFVLGSIFTPFISFLISKFRKNTATGKGNTTSAIDGYSNEEILTAIKFLNTMKNIQTDNASNPLVQEK